jgi:hypothetical protein
MQMIHQLYAMLERSSNTGNGNGKKSPTLSPAAAVAPSLAPTLQDAVQAVNQTQLFQQLQLQQAQAQAQAQAQQMHQMQQMQQYTQEANVLKPATGPGMMESILTILPTMMGPLMGGPSSSSMIIAELEKVPAKPQQSQQATVEIADDDPDVEDALQSMSLSPSAPATQN